VAVGATAKRPVLVNDGLLERKHLCLTVSFDHDINEGTSEQAPSDRS
jgi:hypothetical protein